MCRPRVWLLRKWHLLEALAAPAHVPAPLPQAPARPVPQVPVACQLGLEPGQARAFELTRAYVGRVVVTVWAAVVVRVAGFVRSYVKLNPSMLVIVPCQPLERPGFVEHQSRGNRGVNNRVTQSYLVLIFDVPKVEDEVSCHLGYTAPPAPYP
ncbi:hypothetical protein RHGRI_037392 [Rhododendron griersonianum]|uniref:Secreted protein n=1 Tax=Rhododendron griersonianum TaxID=479676 RepID=A0AAV6HV89_9ERIC|nr:hypothetical protein RHGRI_037392 [Rhododendron griersonianum]